MPSDCPCRTRTNSISLFAGSQEANERCPPTARALSFESNVLDREHEAVAIARSEEKEEGAGDEDGGDGEEGKRK